MILNKQFFKNKNNQNYHTPKNIEIKQQIVDSNEKKIFSSERMSPKITDSTQKISDSKLAVSTSNNISRALSPKNNSVSSAGKIKNNNKQAKINSGTPHKKTKISPLILDTIVNEVVNKHVEDQNNKYDDDINKINECIYLTKMRNDEEERKQNSFANDSLGEKYKFSFKQLLLF